MDQVKQPLLIKKGAEANLFLADWHGRKVIIKERVPKKYRQSELDEQIRCYRTIHEPQLMHEAKKAGVATPIIFLVDVKNTRIIMEYVDGKQMKLHLPRLSEPDRQQLCFSIGQSVARLHQSGVVHGDLTTSNMIVTKNGKVFFVDFGLGEKSAELEAKGVDLHLMKRALESTHYGIARKCFGYMMDGYRSVSGVEMLKNILGKIKEIERRGRYVTERKKEAFSD